ncbi:MAG TPA: endonuclease MutS2 [Myxococcota bacterium]
MLYAPGVPFTVTQKTLERLEWPRILERLEAHAQTPRGRFPLQLREDGAIPTACFEDSIAGVRERLAETAEARRILADGERPPLAGVVDLSDALRRARKGGVLAARELLDLAATLAALRGTARFLAQRAESAPRLADWASVLSDHGTLEDEIEDSLEPSGEVRDRASRALADARRDAHRLAAEIQQRIDRMLRDSDTAAHLSDRYFTVRNDRYVLPVRADARARVRGIVHDASGSGTTVYIEPEALVDLNNRHKQAELEIEREVLRVLRRLSACAAREADAVESELEALAAIDRAFARAALADEMRATAPEVGEEGILHLPLLRHPGLPQDRAVPNDMRLGEGFHVLVVSGPNAGGKTVAMKALALAALCARAGLHVPAGDGARVDLFDAVLADIGDEQSIGENLSTFSAHMANLARIVDAASPRSLVVLDEIGAGTDPGEGAALAQAALEALADTGARVVATTHHGLLKEMAETDPRFANACVDFDPVTLAPTFRLRMGVAGTSSATAVAARMGLRRDIVERAHRFLEREDRQLDRMLAELNASRAALEAEQREAARLREESEAARAEYGRKLTALQERRDKLYRSMREDLDRSFRDAHGQIAAVIRELQRGGGAREAARAREQLQHLEERTREAEREAGLAPDADEVLDPVDWRTARPGDPVRVRGGGTGLLQALPDRRGRVVVGVGSARLTVPMERLGRAEPDAPGAQPRRAPPVRVVLAEAGASDEAAAATQGAGRCDLRGLRVDEALDRLVYALDRAASAGHPRLLVIHGIGTGALREAVRAHLAESPYVTRCDPAPPEEGGDGASIAILG